MSIRRKIIISNLVMMIMPILLLLSMGLLWLNTVGKRYWKPIEEMYEDRNGVISAQNLIYAYQEELWDTNWEEIERLDEGAADNGKMKQSPQMVQLRKELTDLGYHFLVLLDEKTLYSNLSEKEWNQMEEMIGSIPEQVQSVTAGNDNISVIKCSFSEGEEECAIIAVNSGSGNILNKSYLQRYILPYIWIFGACTVVMIIFVNACCSRWIGSLIIPPMEEITRGMKKVRNGELDGEILVYRKDELGEVCAEFNEMQRWLKRSKEEQMKYETYRKELISGISHDLRTPLTTIKGYIGGILDGIADTQEKQKKYLLAVKTRTQDLENLVEQLSAYNKMENHRFHYKMEEIDLSEFIREYLEENDAFIRENNLEIFMNEENEERILMDKSAFKRIIDNVLINSIRYREKEKSRINITIQRNEGKIFWKIGDDGPGVAEEDLEKIFESFCRLDTSRTHCGEGSRLGLAIVKRIVIDHHGILYARNKNGLEICMEFPAV